MLITHIIIALVSLVLSAVVLARPQLALLRLNYGLIAATVSTGGLLVMLGYSAVHVCVMGLVYTGLAVTASLVARHRLASRAIA